MIVHIMFPDGRVARFEIDLSKVESIEDIAEEIARQSCEKIPHIKNMERCVEAYKRWLIPHLYSELMETIFSTEAM